MWPINYARCLLLYHYLHDIFILPNILIFSKILNWRPHVSLYPKKFNVLFSRMRETQSSCKYLQDFKESQSQSNWAECLSLINKILSVLKLSRTKSVTSDLKFTLPCIFQITIIIAQNYCKYWKPLTCICEYLLATYFLTWAQKKIIFIFAFWGKKSNIKKFFSLVTFLLGKAKTLHLNCQE